MSGESNLSRRNFVVGVAGFASMCAIGGVAWAADDISRTGSDTLLRPPGGQDISHFAGSCIRCERCYSVCPQGCISIASMEDGFVQARLPKLDFTKGYCDFCEGRFLCAEVCPVGALETFDPSREKIGVAVIDRDECVAFGIGGCTKCVEACPFGAVAFIEGTERPEVIADACTGCGICEYICPSHSLRRYSGSSNRGIHVVPVG